MLKIYGQKNIKLVLVLRVPQGAVVQNLNILYIDNLIDYAYKNKLHLNLSPISEPEYLQFDNLPLLILQKSIEKLQKIDLEKTIHVTNFKDILIDVLRNKTD